MNSTLYQLLKNDIRASIALARSYRLAGKRRIAIQFMADIKETRKELTEVIANVAS
ncbi:hypothetical protein [Photobacterium profundum]|uniref:hypothetical protein n=1 Tax=Photobacterium profundum TaxID=74109 RepID=UPI0002F4D67C|nr:hypothetical protein [Photobacterium profundum]